MTAAKVLASGSGSRIERLLCRLGRHRLVPFDPNWPWMTCQFCGKELK